MEPSNRQSDGVNLGDNWYLDTLGVEHGVDTLACQLRYRPDPRFNVRKATELGLEPGSWIKELSSTTEQRFSIGGREFSTATLTRQLFKKRDEFRLLYLTDTLYSEKLLENLHTFCPEPDLFLTECAYRNEDAHLAKTNQHLCCQQVADLSRELNAKRTAVFHLSRRYTQQGPQQHLTQLKAELSLVTLASSLSSEQSPS